MVTLREEVLKFCLDYFGTEPDYPWDDEPDYAVLRHKKSRKWYALIMRINREKLGLDGGEVDILNVKCDPIALGSLLAREGCHPAYHMSKAHWLTVRLDGTVPMKEIEGMIRMSYEGTGRKNGVGRE